MNDFSTSPLVQFASIEQGGRVRKTPVAYLQTEETKVRRTRSSKQVPIMADGVTSIIPKSNKGPKRPRSVVWYYFDKILNEPQRARCKMCGATCHHANNTSNLFKHLRVKHPSTYREAESQREAEMELYLELKAKSGKPIIRPGIRGRRPKALTAIPIVKAEETVLLNNSPRETLVVRKSYGAEKVKQTMTRALLKMITVDLHPASIVNGKGFRDFVKSLDSRYEIPSKKVIVKNLLSELAEETKHKIKLDVVIASYFALTVETWTYRDSQIFMTLSAHFIKDSWEMSSIVLETFDCTEEKTETNIATSFKRITEEWGITDRVIALVADNTEDVIHSAALVNGWEELVCFGHTINIVITNALTSVAELVRIQKKTSDAVAYFEKSTKAADTLAAVQQQHSLPVHKLKQENLRYWTSTYAMFERMVEQYEAVNTVLCFLGKDHMCLCDDEVELIRSVVEVLKPFEAATKELCTEQYTYMSKVIPIATLLQQVTSVGIATLPGPQSALKNALITQMQQLFANVENNYKLAVSTLLDPRFKRHAFTDLSALDIAHQRLLNELATVVQNSDTPSLGNDAAYGNDPTGSFWNMFDRKVSEAGAMKTSASEADNETRRYFKEANIPRNANPLTWWKLNEVQFPNLKVLAQKYLCIPATSTASNQLFTKEGDVIAYKREQIKPNILHTMLFLNKNLA
ncbi:E3 SUMO-protein ligase ZBED1-like [Biomphalaria glabrata]|uniref:E3 SUMO-protein ligase ZBED1-like n=1 Tax=Biomphalaria glabrata TaxID=6526 RepID=A0A9U8DYU7_BIOGL|nr:E3 SUMO-protein ligase ZBED1-like [Biomphalaria glabrata]